MVERTGFSVSRGASWDLQGYSAPESGQGPRSDPRMHPHAAHIFFWSATGQNVPDWGLGKVAFLSQRTRRKQAKNKSCALIIPRGSIFYCFFYS